MCQILKPLTLICLLLCSFSCFAQIGVGKWREHLPYRKANRIEDLGETLFCLTNSGVFGYSLGDHSVETYSKINGLSDIDILTIKGSENNQLLFLGYSNGNIDLLKRGEIVNIPDINRSQIFGDKGIYSVLFESDRALVGTGFGIVVLNLEKNEVSDTYFIGPEGNPLCVTGLVRWGGYYWAATNKGVFKASATSVNLADFNRWEHVVMPLDSEQAVTHIALYGDRLICIRTLSSGDSQLLEWSGLEWNPLILSLPIVTSLRVEENLLWVCAGGELWKIDTNGSILERISSLGNEVLDVRDALVVEGNQLFLADFGRGMIRYQKGTVPDFIGPAGPYSINVGDLSVSGLGVSFVPGRDLPQFADGDLSARVERFVDESWSGCLLTGNGHFKEVQDVYLLTSDKQDETKIYAGSWGYGVFVVGEDGEEDSWSALNYSLGNGEVFIGGMASCDDGSLWVLDAGTSDVVKVRSAQGNWSSLYYPALSGRYDIHSLMISATGDKWGVMGEELFVFNEFGDDYFRNFHVKDINGRLLTSQVNMLKEDQEGDIWVGTGNGVMVYDNPQDVWEDESLYAYRPVLRQDDRIQYLMETKRVNCIAVDGANQKWLGTEASGAFLVTPDGGQQILHFNSKNSPLLSDRVLCVAVDPRSGEVFFGTDRGLISYRNSVTAGASDFSKVYAYPNPVREDYTGDIVVTGLMDNSSVKIVDVVGNLVFEGRSNGGQFLWDGCGFNQSRVSTGVYLILCSSEDGGHSKIVKLLVIR